MSYCADNENPAPLEPASLSQNPLFVWGAAVTDGFFTDEELPLAVAFVEQQFGPFTIASSRALFLEQIVAIATLMASGLKESELPRLVKLCGMMGLFEVYDRSGKVVASPMHAHLTH